MRAWLIQIDAWDGDSATPIRMASHDDERLCHLNDATWWPVIARLPTLRYDYFDGSFDAGSITSPSGSLEASIEAIPALPALAIHDARIRIWAGRLGDAWGAFTLFFDGRVKEQPTVDAGTASIDFGADDGWLDQPLLPTYGGTGGADGGEALDGQVKPLAFGAPRFIPATLIDAVDNIYQVHGAGAMQSVDMAFERLNRFSAPVGDAANFASLKAAEIARGQWATCLAEGLVRFGAPVDGMLSFHVSGDAVGGWSRLPGAIIARIADMVGKGDRVAAADVAALNIARPWPLSIFENAQTTARDLIQRIAMSVNAVAYVDWLGMLRLAPLAIGAATMTVAADGSSLPPVASVKQLAIAAPYWKVAQGAAVTWQVHGLNDIAFSSPLNPRGPFDPEEVYREGDMVTLANGSQWLFIGLVPAAGSIPADDNADWFRLADDITAANITYEGGETLESLKPAQPGATNGATAEQVEQWTAMHEALNLSALKIAKLLQTANAMLQARATLDGKPVGTVVSEVRTITDSAIEDLKLLGARNGDGTAFNLNIDTVLADGTRTLAQKFTEVEAGTEAVAASVETLNEALVETDGTVLAKAVLSLKANGHVGGLVATNDGSTAQLDLDFDVTRLWKPDGTLLLVAGPAGEVYAPKLRVDTLVFGAMDPEFEANQSISSAQYSQKIPGGLIMKTGRYRSLIGDETSLSIVFEDPFPTECLSFVPVPNINAASVYRDLWLQTIGNPTRFGATIQAQSSTSNNNNIDGFDWMAWGR